MNEKEQLNQAREQLKQSIKNVFQDLRTYGNAVANRTGAIYAEKKDDLVSRMEFARLEREMERDIKARTREHKSGMKEALRENDRLQRQERRLRFKEGVKQKTSSVFGKLGQVKNDMLAKLNPSNIDVKLRDFYEKAQIKGLEIANKGKEVYNNTAQKIDNITTQQIAKYYEYQAAKEAERIEKENDRLQRQERRLRYKEGIKQKTSSVFGKLGQVKNDMLAKLNPSNIDVKLRNFYEKAQIKGLEIANKGKEVYNNTAQKIDNFTTQQIANYYERKEARIEAKEFKEAARRAEKEEIERIKERVRERKEAMKEALRTQEREMYENKHLENQARKQELMDSLFGSSEIQEERVSYAR